MPNQIKEKLTMCLSIPAKIVSISGKEADVEVYSQSRKVYLAVENAEVGDWVLIYGGTALTILDADAATETIELLKRLIPVELDKKDF